ncbi:MAG: hypothetical protein WC683_08365 [bacterium]
MSTTKKLDFTKPMPNPFDEVELPKKEKEKIVLKDKAGNIYELMPNPFVDDCESPESPDEVKPPATKAPKTKSPKPKAPKPNSPVSRLWKK